MPFVHRLGERVGDAGTDANQSCLLDAELGCDLISGAEADAADVAGQTIRVLRDEPNGIGAVSLVDAHGARRTDAVAVQKQHNLANHPLLGPAGDDPLSTLRADAGHLAQAIGLLLDDLEYGFAEGPHELLRIDRPDAADHPGAEIFLDPLHCCRCRSLEERGSELDAVRAVVDPASARLDELASRDHRGVAEYRDQVALPAGFDTQDAEAVLIIVECDALDQTGQNLGRRARPEWLHHRRRMNREGCTRYRDRAPSPCRSARAHERRAATEVVTQFDAVDYGNWRRANRDSTISTSRCTRMARFQIQVSVGVSGIRNNKAGERDHADLDTGC